MTPERLAELKALCEAATPGPWEWTDTYGCDSDDDELDNLFCGQVIVKLPDTDDQGWRSASTRHLWFGDMENCTGCDIANAQLIAAARTAVPELIAEVERLQGIERRLREYLEDITSTNTWESTDFQAWYVVENLNAILETSDKE